MDIVTKHAMSPCNVAIGATSLIIMLKLLLLIPAVV